MPAPKRTRSARKRNAAKKKSVSKDMVRHFVKRTRTKKSDLEEMFLGWLKEAGIPYKWQHRIGRCHVDVFIEPNLVIEINGCFFHGHTKCQNKLTTKQKAWKLRDSKRYAFLKKSNKLLLVWGCEMERRKEEYLQRIRRHIEESSKCSGNQRSE